MKMLFVVVAIALTFVLFGNNSVHSQSLDRTHIGYVNPLDSGSLCNVAALNTALSAISTNSRTLMITATNRAKVACTWDITSDVTIPENVTLNFGNGAQLCPAAGVTVTHKGGIIDTNAQIFCTTGAVKLEGKAAQNVKPQWWGASGSSGAAVTTELQKWAASVSTTGGKLIVPPGTYIYSGNVSLYKNTTVECAGAQSAVFKNSNTAQSLFVAADIANTHNITITGCAFDAAGYNVEDFLSFIAFSCNITNVCSDIRASNNHFYDSAYVGDATVKQRQYIVLLHCEDCWVQGNHLEQGGRIKVGRPSKRIHITNNIVNYVNDNGITIVDTVDSALTEDSLITDNILKNCLSSCIYVGADGQGETSLITNQRIIVARNIISGYWDVAGITVTGTTTAREIHIVDNIIIHDATTLAADAGINVSRQDIATAAAENIIIARNTIVLRNGALFSLAGIEFGGAGGFQTAVIENNNLSTSNIRLTGTLSTLRFAQNTFVRLITTAGLVLTNVVMVDNILADGSTNAMMSFPSTTAISGLIARNVIRQSGTGIGIEFNGAATHTVNLIDNNITVGTGAAISFTGGAALATTAQRWNNFGDVASNVNRSLLQVLKRTYALNLAAPGAVPGCATSGAQNLLGAVMGDVCKASLDVARVESQIAECEVSAADNITVRMCQSSGAATDPDGAGANYKVILER